MFEYDKELCKAAKKLDQYDLKDIINKCKKEKILIPEDIMDIIRVQFSIKCGMEIEDILDEFGIGEFMDYLTEKYAIQWHEIITYKMRV